MKTQPIHDTISPHRRVRGPGLQGVVGRVPSRGAISVAVYVNSARKESCDAAAFTRGDLIAVVAMVCVFFTLTLRLAANTGGRSHAMVCMDNLQRLTRAWSQFAEDHQGALPASAANGGTLQSWVTGWLDFSSNPDNTNTLNLSRSQLGPYAKDVALYRCPSDQSQVTIGGKKYFRVRSYSMSGAMNDTSGTWISPYYRIFTKMSDIYNPPPSACFVFIDEHAGSINDGLFGVTMPDSPALTRWVDFPAARHDRAGSLSFADGHVELHRWVDERTTPMEFLPTFLSLNVSQPNNLDVLWLTSRTTGKF